MQQFLQAVVVGAALIIGFFLLRPSGNANESTTPTASAAEQMLLKIESRIAKQEDKKDVRCWSSVNKIQTFLSGMPIEPDAIGQRVERYVDLIDEIWIEASVQATGAEIGKASLSEVFEGIFPNRVSVERDQVSFQFDNQFTPLKILEDSVEDYSDTIESWRLLQSWALRKASSDSANKKESPKLPFSEESLNLFRDFLVVYDIALLKSAKQVAQSRKLASVDVESMNIAFDQLLNGEFSSQLKESDAGN